ncbi:glycosyltransferase [Candidatus Pacearchaeota archaeon]|nr:glycosyltransferase [Candidatus Pacearchaeota archaeon]
MKILYIVNSYPDESNPAAQPFVKSQIDSVIRAGAIVDVFDIRGQLSRLNYLKAISSVRHKLKRESYDVIHGHYVYSGLIAALRPKTINVVSFMGSDLYGTFNSKGEITAQGHIDIILSKLLQLVIDGIIVKSPEMLQMLITKRKAIVLPNGVNFNIFTKMSKTTAKEKLQLSLEKKYILFAGDYLSPRKGYAILRNAVNILKKAHPDYEILLAHKVPHETVPLYMNASEVLALPSLKEGSPNVVKEAIACNLPVVATDVGDVKQIIGNIQGCFLAARNSHSFADAIHSAASANIDFNGRDHIDHLRSEIIAKRLIAFYERLLVAKRKDTGMPCTA